MTDVVTSLPSQTGSYKGTRFNALRHGVLSRYTVLPWEDDRDYQALLSALICEHSPQGLIEEHLVEELAGILWRKRRLRMAEAAAHQRGLEKTLDPWRDTVKAALAHLGADHQIEQVVNAILATPEDTLRDLKDVDDDEAMTIKALDILRAGIPKAYENALAALREDTRDRWEDKLSCDPEELDEDEEPAVSNAAGLLRFLENEVLPWYAQRRKELENRPLIRAQAFGESLDPDKLERLGRYEVHLDRKLERTLAMLIRLRDLRHNTTPK